MVKIRFCQLNSHNYHKSIYIIIFYIVVYIKISFYVMKKNLIFTIIIKDNYICQDILLCYKQILLIHPIILKDLIFTIVYSFHEKTLFYHCHKFKMDE